MVISKWVTSKILYGIGSDLPAEHGLVLQGKMVKVSCTQ